LQKEPNIPVQISDIDVEGVREVDDKLVILARQLNCPILTNDYNLNRVAGLQGVSVLNVNDLANAVKSVLLPGEVLNVRIMQEGREAGQGIGYMDDGTMVVVENGREYMNMETVVVVTKVLQTAAGRMIFARPEDRSE
ncbi:MAG TPA: TRAM domain-containing protein, partial [Anaerolineaceae bacterium]|nr:TRAM domain-containing protein [Anaerolineaceae bacterium]